MDIAYKNAVSRVFLRCFYPLGTFKERSHRAEYMKGIGLQGVIPYTVVRIYEDYGDYFTYNKGLSDEINNYLPCKSND